MRSTSNIQKFILTLGLGASTILTSSAATAQFLYGTTAGTGPSGGIIELDLTNTSAIVQTQVLTIGGDNSALAINISRKELFFIDNSNSLVRWAGSGAPTVIADTDQLGITGFNKPRNAAIDQTDGSFWFFTNQSGAVTSGNQSNVLNRVILDFVGPSVTFTGLQRFTLSEIPNEAASTPVNGCNTTPCNAMGDIVISPSRLLFAQTQGLGANASRLYQIDLSNLNLDTAAVTPNYYTQITENINIQNVQIGYNSSSDLLFGVRQTTGDFYQYTTSPTGVPSGTPTLVSTIPGAIQLNDVSDVAINQRVPFPLPVAGAAMGMAWSRRLRRRIAASNQA